MKYSGLFEGVEVLQRVKISHDDVGSLFLTVNEFKTEEEDSFFAIKPDAPQRCLRCFTFSSCKNSETPTLLLELLFNQVNKKKKFVKARNASDLDTKFHSFPNIEVSISKATKIFLNYRLEISETNDIICLEAIKNSDEALGNKD